LTFSLATVVRSARLDRESMNLFIFVTSCPCRLCTCLEIRPIAAPVPWSTTQRMSPAPQRA